MLPDALIHPHHTRDVVPVFHSTLLYSILHSFEQPHRLHDIYQSELWSVLTAIHHGRMQTADRDVSTTLFGRRYDTPVLMAPVGVQSIFHPDKETGLADVCAELNLPYILSTASSSSIEEVADASGAGPRWFQLYWPSDDDVTISLLDRAKKNGFTVLVVTLDTWSLAWYMLFPCLISVFAYSGPSPPKPRPRCARPCPYVAEPN